MHGAARIVGSVFLTACIVAAAAAEAGASATLSAVRQITAPATTRVIVQFSAPVHYRLHRVAGRPDLGVPPRVYVDCLDTRLAPTAPRAVALAQGPLVRVRATQRSARLTRLILDVPGLSEFGAFPMPDPFRLVIDVRGRRREGPPRTAAVRAQPTPRPPAVTAASLPRPVAPAVDGARRPTPVTASARRFKVVIDPGHGGKDPGAIGVGGVAEKDVVLAIALQLKERLAAAGFDVVLTRQTDTFLALEERTARANAEQADLFVSIHANASLNPKLSGTETYYLNNTNDHATIRLAELENGLRDLTGRDDTDRGASLILSDLIQSYKIEESVALAERVQHALVAALTAHGTPVDDLGVKRGPFYVLVGAGMPCVLVEVSFLTNRAEGTRLAQRGYQEVIAEGLLHGIRGFVENMRMAGNL